MQVVGLGDGRVIRRADRYRHLLGGPDIHRAHPVSHPVDIGVGIAGVQLGQDDVRIGRHLIVLAHRDDGVLIVGRSRDRTQAARDERDREACGLVQATVEPFAPVVGDADPDDGPDDQHDDRGADCRRERHPGPKRWRLAENAR